LICGPERKLSKIFLARLILLTAEVDPAKPLSLIRAA
jgi:hypothetical protein